MRIVSLCTGYGGLDRAVEQVIPGARTVLVSDIDKGACKILALRYPHAPNIGDFTTYDWTGVECDILTAGFPCQPVSNAGKRKGTTDDRWLFDDILAAIGRMAAPPRLLVFENVLGLLTANGGDAMARVVEGLASIGYVGRYGTLRASDVGAPHKRERVFIVATPYAERGRRDWRARAQRWGALGRAVADGGPQGALLPTPRASDGDKGLRSRDGARAEYNRRGDGADLATVLALLPTPAVNDMGVGKTVEAWDAWTAKMRAKHGNGNGHGASLAIELARVGSQWGKFAPAIARWERVIKRPAPSPSEGARVREWMQGLPDGWITDVPGITNNEALKAAGNGVIPQQAAAAISHLLAAL